MLSVIVGTCNVVSTVSLTNIQKALSVDEHGLLNGSTSRSFVAHKNPGNQELDWQLTTNQNKRKPISKKEKPPFFCLEKWDFRLWPMATLSDWLIDG